MVKYTKNGVEEVVEALHVDCDGKTAYYTIKMPNGGERNTTHKFLSPMS